MRASIYALALIPGVALSSPPDATALLEQQVEIERTADGTLEACEVGYCSVFRSKTQEGRSLLPEFAFLYLWHVEGFGWQPPLPPGTLPFKERARNDEATLRAALSRFCPDKPEDPLCVLKGMKKRLGISVSGVKYDEGSRNEFQIDDQLGSNQPIHPDAEPRADARGSRS